MGGIGFALGGIEWGRASALATGAGRNGKKLNRGEDNGYRSTHAVYQNIAALLSGRLDESACLRDNLSQRVVSIISNISEVESEYQRHIPQLPPAWSSRIAWPNGNDIQNQKPTAPDAV